ncbi:MAG: hypothetical protein ABI903_07345 [Actinomycetota bacterium]
MTRFSEATGRPVISTESASTVGVIAGFIIGLTSKRIVALRLSKTNVEGDTLHWEDLTAFGPDAVTVPSEAVIVPAREPASELSLEEADVVGKRLLSDAGAELGMVEDVEFDPATGALQNLVSAADRVAGDRLIACGSYAVIVHAV